MTESDPHSRGTKDNAESTVNRRSYLSAIATAPFITTTDTTTATSPSIQPDELLITQAQLPQAFTTSSGIDADDMFDSVQPPSRSPPSRDQIAFNSFWVGDDPDEPLWIAASSVCISVRPESVATATETVSHEYAEFIDAYDAETAAYWHFDRQYNEFEKFREWRTGIYIGHEISSEELFEVADEPKLVDVLRLQYVNNILLGTVLFGPTDWYWSYKELLDRLTEYQRKQALSLTDAESRDTSGDE